MAGILANNLKRRSGIQDLSYERSCETWSCNDLSPTLTKQSTTTRVDGNFHRSYVGWDIPGFHRKAQSGGLIPYTPWRSLAIENETTSASFDIKYVRSPPSTGWTRNYYPQGWPDFLDSWGLTFEKVKAYAPTGLSQYPQEAMAKIYNRGFDALTFLAEFKDVVRMFRSVAVRLAKMQWPRNWREINSEWLAYRYGWRTLLFDLHGLSEALSDLKTKSSQLYTARAGDVYSTSFSETWDTEHTYYWLTHVVTDRVSVKVRGSVAAEMSVPIFQFNPLVTAWEVIPFSFVVDWILGVGRALSAISYVCRAGNYVASEGFVVTVEREYSSSISSTKAYFISGSREQHGKSTATLLVRRPCLVSNSPHFALKIDGLKVIDLVALILQRLH